MNENENVSIIYVVRFILPKKNVVRFVEILFDKSFKKKSNYHDSLFLNATVYNYRF